MNRKNLLITAMAIACMATVSSCSSDETPQPENNSPYITKVLDYRPAPGQFTNKYPKYAEGDTQEDMNRKVLEAIGNNKKGMVSLGGYGGYVEVGFDHTIENRPGLRDFRVLGNAFMSDKGYKNAGSSEPGIIEVAYDRNRNGKPDKDEWYTIQGSAQVKDAREAWYADAEKAGNNTRLYTDYEITYYKPTNDPTSGEDVKDYIRWEDNQGNSGFRAKLMRYHKQSYYPLWIKEDKISFKGICLPQNGVNKGTDGTDYWIQYTYGYGYADNVPNGSDGSAIDIDWAVTKDGKPANLPGVDFIRIYTGVNQECGWLGEISTEIIGVEDLHLLNIKIKQ